MVQLMLAAPVHWNAWRGGKLVQRYLLAPISGAGVTRRPGVGNLFAGAERDLDFSAGWIFFAVLLTQPKTLRFACMDEFERLSIAERTRRMQRPIGVVH